VLAGPTLEGGGRLPAVKTRTTMSTTLKRGDRLSASIAAAVSCVDENCLAVFLASGHV